MSTQNGGAGPAATAACNKPGAPVCPTSDRQLPQKKRKGDKLSTVLETIISQPLHSHHDGPINFSLDLLEPSMFGGPPLLGSGAGEPRPCPALSRTVAGACHATQHDCRAASLYVDLLDHGRFEGTLLPGSAGNGCQPS